MTHSYYRPKGSREKSKTALILSVVSVVLSFSSTPIRAILLSEPFCTGNCTYLYGTVFQDIAGLVPAIVATVLAIISLRTLKDQTVEHTLKGLAKTLNILTLISSAIYAIIAFMGVIAIIFFIATPIR